MNISSTILVLGQTPPPYHGQAMMIKRTLDGDYGENIKLIHVPMSFSNSLVEVGKFNFSKIFSLFSIIFLCYKFKFKYKCNYLYYFPAGPNLIPIFRDLLLLSFLWPLNLKRIFHFRAGGISTYFGKKNKLFASLVKIIYGKPYLSIRLSEYNPNDHLFFHSKKSVILYNGLEDQQSYLKPFTFLDRDTDFFKNSITLCFLGILKDSKGVTDILKMLLILKQNIPTYKIRVLLIGAVESLAYESFLKKEIDQINSQTISVQLTGVLTGREKVLKMNTADLFIFPSYYESEGLPGSIIEMMSLGKGIIASNWRGIPSLVNDSYNGFLVNIKSPQQLAEALMRYINDPKLIQKHGQHSRSLYLEKFTMAKYYQNLKCIFQELTLFFLFSFYSILL